MEDRSQTFYIMLIYNIQIFLIDQPLIILEWYAVKKYLEDDNIKLQLVKPHNHRINTA